MPGKFKPWQFGEIEGWLENKDLQSCAREGLMWLMNEKLQCNRGDLPTLLTKQVFIDNGLEALLNKFDGSCFRVVDQVYPGIFKQWQFTEEEQLIWFQENRFEIAADATKWLIEDRLGIPFEDIPKRISIREFHMNGLSKLLDLFNQNLFQVIENAYKGQFKPWQFSEQNEIWNIVKYAHDNALIKVLNCTVSNVCLTYRVYSKYILRFNYSFIMIIEC